MEYLTNIDGELKDSLVCLEYNEYKIGIATGGDVGRIVAENIKKLIDNGCNVIITACRTSGGTCDVTNGYKGKFDIHYLSCPYLSFPNNKALSESDLENVAKSKVTFLGNYLKRLLDNNDC